jgi:hypothetical protein
MGELMSQTFDSSGDIPKLTTPRGQPDQGGAPIAVSDPKRAQPGEQ